MKDRICFSGAYHPTRPAAIRTSVIHRADKEYPFLHDTMITFYAGRLLCAWYNCADGEIQGRTVIRGRWSRDGGATWSAPEIIACEDEDKRWFDVPVTFLEAGNELHAYVTRMRAHDRPFGYRLLKKEGDAWRVQYDYDTPLLVNTLFQSVGADGAIAAGRMARRQGELPLIPVLLAASRVAPADLRITPMPGPWLSDDYALYRPAVTTPFPFPAEPELGSRTPWCPESSVLADQNRVTVITRNDHGSAFFFTSEDGGSTFESARDCALPIGPVKVCAGSLRDGRQYLIYNDVSEVSDRSRLVLALRERHGEPFTRAYLLFSGWDETLNAGPNWHYPCAAEKDGALYVSCTASGEGVERHAALAVIPLESLAKEGR